MSSEYPEKGTREISKTKKSSLQNPRKETKMLADILLLGMTKGGKIIIGVFVGIIILFILAAIGGRGNGNSGTYEGPGTGGCQ